MTINAIRDNINNEIGHEVDIIYNEGRNKIYKYHGKLVEVYHNVFIIKDGDGKKSFSYYDVLTNTVNVSFNCKSDCFD